jgi:hypothetical protein
MEKPWYADLTPEEDAAYTEAVNRVTAAVRQSVPFGKAAELVEVEDEGLRAAILDDALKVLIAEMHFAGKKPLGEVAGALGLPLDRVEKARDEMLREVEDAAIEAYKSKLGEAGNA